MKRFLAVLAAGAILASCATTGTPTDSAQSVYALEATLTAAMQVATTYAELPTCGTSAPLICSDPATVTRIQAAAATAVAAVQTAQALVTSSGASSAQTQAALLSATQAVTTLSTLTSSVRT